MTERALIRPGSTRLRWAAAGLMLLFVPVLAFGQAGEAPLEPAEATAPITDERASYSYLRTLEGSATVAAAGQGIGEPLETNQPLLTGDLIRVESSSRLELALSDRNRLFLGGATSVVLERIAFSGDREERVTVLRLEGGELLLAIADEALGDELPRVITSNATVYVQEPGEYRVETGVGSDGEAWTRIVTRRGYAEVVTDRGSSVVRADESIVALGSREANLELGAADEPDDLERWSGVLTDRAESASRSARYVEPHLADDAAPLDNAGNWIEVDSVSYWRPYVSDGWRPYWQGRWAWTPSGYTWVSYEPWGWVPYHYGRWCSLPGYGWAWRPGALYSPAWVYWNWTSGYAGWVPIGYYSHFYSPWYNSGFRYGVYGWAGGGWGIYSDWNFAPVHCFRDRRFRGHMRRGRDMERESGHREPPRGLLTTDTRDLRPERLDRTDRTEDLLHRIGKRQNPRTGGDLPDMTDFVGRKGRLPNEVARVIVPPTGKERGVIRDIDRVAKVAETPTWRQKDASGDDKTDRTAGTGKTPLEGGSIGDKGDKGGKGGWENPGATPGVVLDKGRTTAPNGAGKSTPQIDSRGTAATKGTVGGTGGTGATGATGARGSADARAGSLKSAPSQRSGPSSKGTISGGKERSPSSGATRPAPPAPVTKSYEPTGPGAGKAPAPDGDDRQLWKSRGGESAPVQRVVGSVRRPSPGSESGSKNPSAAGGATGSPGTVGSTRGSAPTRGNTGSGSGSGYATPGGKNQEPAYRPPSSGNGSTGRNPAGAGSRVYEPSVKSQPAQRSQPAPTVRSQPAPTVRSQPSQPSQKPQDSQRTQGPRSYPPTVKSAPSQGSQRSQPAPPAVRSQPSQRSQPSYGSQGSQGSKGAQPSTQSQPSGRSSSGGHSAGKSTSSGSKSSSRSGQTPPPPPPKKDGGGN